jgi:hypothetical protein
MTGFISFLHNHTSISSNLTYSTRIFVSTGATAPSGPGPPHYPGFTITFRHTRSVGLLWTSDQPDADTSIWQHSQEIDINAPSEIRTRNPSKRAAADLHLRPRATGIGTLYGDNAVNRTETQTLTKTWLREIGLSLGLMHCKHAVTACTDVMAVFTWFSNKL